MESRDLQCKWTSEPGSRVGPLQLRLTATLVGPSALLDAARQPYLWITSNGAACATSAETEPRVLVIVAGFHPYQGGGRDPDRSTKDLDNPTAR